MKHSTHSRKLRQLDRLVKVMKQAMLERQPKAQVEKIRLKIATVLHQLRGILSKKQLVQKLGAFAVLFGLSTASYAQTFSAPVINPFGFTSDSTSYVGGICMADFDNDGDLDMLMGGYYGSIDYYENTGTATSPIFSTPGQVNAFGLTGSYYYALLTTVDLDNDGDFDVLAGEYYGNLNYFENTGTASAPAFAAVQVNPFGLSAAANFSYPTFADLDGDGDMDLLVNEYYGNFKYYENTGTASAPAFAAAQANPFGLTAASQVSFSALVDIDADGDYDVLSSMYYGNLAFYENTEFNAGIDELDNTASVAPNPFDKAVTIVSETAIESIDVYDVSGVLVHHEINPGNNIQLDALKSGIYLMHIVDQNGRVSQQKIEKR